MTLEKEKAVCANTTAAIDACINDYNRRPTERQDENTLFKAALSLAGNGYLVFPVKPNDKRPLTLNGLNDASNHIQIIRQWWQQWPQANIGIRTGSLSGFFVLDIDGDDGENSLSKLEQQYTPLPPTHEVITGGGSRHLYFKMPEYS